MLQKLTVYSKHSSKEKRLLNTLKIIIGNYQKKMSLIILLN